jgi:hypothetical protein
MALSYVVIALALVHGAWAWIHVLAARQYPTTRYQQTLAWCGIKHASLCWLGLFLGGVSAGGSGAAFWTHVFWAMDVLTESALALWMYYPDESLCFTMLPYACVLIVPCQTVAMPICGWMAIVKAHPSWKCLALLPSLALCTSVWFRHASVLLQAESLRIRQVFGGRKI